MVLASAFIRSSSSAAYERGERFFIMELATESNPLVAVFNRSLADSMVFAGSDDWPFLPNRVNHQELQQEDLEQPFYCLCSGTSSLA